MRTNEITPAATMREIEHGRDWGRTVALYALLGGVAVAFTIAFGPGAHAAPLADGIDPSTWATTAIDFLKKAWVFVIIAEIIAALTYAIAFFAQSWFPSFFHTFQGDWIKKAVIIGIAAHPVMGALFAAAEGAKAGFSG